MNNKVGFGIYIPKYNYEFKSRISDFLSIYTAELTAIKFSLIWLLENNIQENTTIYSDSLSALQSIQNKKSKTRPNTIIEILELNQKLRQSVTIAWIPSHSGIRGNEVADLLAKTSLNHPAINLKIKHEAYETHSLIYYFIKKKWDSHFKNSNTCKFNKIIQPQISFCVKFSSKIRKKEVLITRLRLGKCKLNKYLKDMRCHHDGLCTLCLQPENIEHFLLDCPHSNIGSKIKTAVNHLSSNSEKMKYLLNNPLMIDLLYQLIDRDL
jgi:ribonuclease HI